MFTIFCSTILKANCQLYHSIVGSMTVMVKDPQIDQMLRDFTTAREQLQPTSTFSTLPKIREYVNEFFFYALPPSPIDHHTSSGFRDAYLPFSSIGNELTTDITQLFLIECSTFPSKYKFVDE
ncbi:hypothetical protein M514_22346 [Trichuris suis]|uniref:Uncharacterized protein n=1 Tax=Trichuris suis TaxID=68888 RepID=A0A085N7H4_9BILA|nr:hypothetical protein M514_22346 [Trichuris suis]